MPRPLRRRPAPTSFASVGCWLLSSPVTHRAVTVRFAACETLASPRFPAPPPGGRLRPTPWPDARPCADGALRHGPTEQRPPGQSLLRPRTAAAVAAAAPPFPSVCLVCESALSVTPVPASCVSPPRLRLSSHSEISLSPAVPRKQHDARRPAPVQPSPALEHPRGRHQALLAPRSALLLPGASWLRPRLPRATPPFGAVLGADACSQ